jgi:hypothetical protein
MTELETHACGLVGEHVGDCLECGRHADLGWAHVCIKCWEGGAP